jgi:hypothetical protein
MSLPIDAMIARLDATDQRTQPRTQADVADLHAFKKLLLVCNAHTVQGGTEQAHVQGKLQELV